MVNRKMKVLVMKATRQLPAARMSLVPVFIVVVGLTRPRKRSMACITSFVVYVTSLLVEKPSSSSFDIAYVSA